ncbi:hypothetical protein DPMN_113008 [Dreissena polymorpha]|uniref:Uncharacterized protein n=1 Tax=Dreissena polymorpha TaxID=45954 RepID=A0A9D4KI84_DREPO|nr:hypothetical protein DPMN_113008 [Dreissena polymorpha]
MRVLAVVSLCIVVAVFGQEGPPDTLNDEEGNRFIVKTNGESMQLFNDTGSLVSSVLNSKGWVVVISSDSRECIISNPRYCYRSCFKLVPFEGPVDDNVQDFCKGRPIMQQVPVPCDQNMGCCCRWRRIAWWPCLEPVCHANDESDICVDWGCAKWAWHWHWIQDCVSGWERPFFIHHV